MKKSAKIISLLLAGMLAVSSLTACGGGNDGSSGSTASTGGDSSQSSQSSQASSEAGGEESSEVSTGDGDYTITMAYIGNEQPRQNEVLAKVAEQVKTDTGMGFETIQLGFGDYQQKLNLMLSGGDRLDILPIVNSQAGSYINAGQIVDLSQYIDEYGKDIIEFMGEDIAKSGAVKGFIYGIPANKESASRAGIVMRKDIVYELQIDVDSIHTYADLPAIFDKVKAAHPELDAIAGVNIVYQIQDWDTLCSRSCRSTTLRALRWAR